MSNVMELIQDFKDGKVEGISKHKLRDESIQEKNRTFRLKTLKKESLLREKLLFLTEIAIPWNPATGLEDDTYNRDQKFRPYLAQTTVMLMCKGMANENPQAKEALLKRSGVTEWDTTDLENVTKTDREIFKRFRVPRLFTLPVAKVNIPKFTGNAFGKDYLMNIERDEETGEIVGEVPLILKVNKLMADMAFEEVSQYEEDIKSGRFNPTEKEKKEHIKNIWSKVVVSSEYPQNYGICAGIKLDAQQNVANKNEICEQDNSEMLTNLFLVRRNKEVKESLAKYTEGSYTAIDFYDDFYEFDMTCPKADDPKDIGQGTRYEKPMIAFKDVPGSEDYIKSLRSAIDADNDWEKIFLSSVYVSKFNSSLEDLFLQCVRTIIDINSPFLTDKVVSANAEVISLIFGEEGEERIGTASISGGVAGKLDEAKAFKANKENTINIADMAENNTNEEVLVEEINIDGEDIEF